MVKNMKLTDDNYEIALKLLEKRYANQKTIKEAYLAELMNLVPGTLSNKQDAADLRKLAFTLVEHVQALKNLGDPLQHWDVILVYIIKEKVDNISR